MSRGRARAGAAKAGLDGWASQEPHVLLEFEEKRPPAPAAAPPKAELPPSVPTLCEIDRQRLIALENELAEHVLKAERLQRSVDRWVDPAPAALARIARDKWHTDSELSREEWQARWQKDEAVFRQLRKAEMDHALQKIQLSHMHQVTTYLRRLCDQARELVQRSAAVA